MLRADLRARAGERDIDSRAGRDAMLARSGIGQEGFDAFLERIEALAEGAAGFRWSRFQPGIADRFEAAVLASQPFQPECLHLRQPLPPQKMQEICTSALGSVKGKNDGKKRVFTLEPKNAFMA